MKNLALTAHVDQGVELLQKDVESMPDRVLVAMQKLKPAELQMLLKPLDRIKELLNKNKFNVEGKMLMEKQNDLIKEGSAPGVFDWLETDVSHRTWSQGRVTPFLFVSGPTGAGKTYFTYQCYYNLMSKATEADQLASGSANPRQVANVACFYFQHGKSEAQTLEAVLATIIMQIAEQDAKLTQSLANALEKVPKTQLGSKYLWEQAILSRFGKSADFQGPLCST